MKNKPTKERLCIFHKEFREDLAYWIKIDRRTAGKIFDMIEAIVRGPFNGIGKPEPLKQLGSSVWSRRITQEHRLVYIVNDTTIDFLQCRYHY